MKADDLQKMQPGFDDPVLNSQLVFRRALQALSMPGRLVDLPGLAALPRQGHSASAMLLLALVDSDCALWLSPRLAGTNAQTWLRFHTGCRFVQEPAQANFLWLCAQDRWPHLGDMQAGTDEYPDQSATCIMETSSIQTGARSRAWSLSGPGIASPVGLTAEGLPADFAAQWAGNHAAFPRGVDVFLTTATQVLGLPRSTMLQSFEMSEA
jgi:alpha-D-ribose 1-methylphosphonate 5-triphosphate synthase subunit PhnH